MIATIGLAFILLGWLIQLIFVYKKKREIQPWFLVCYVVGVVLLVIDNFSGNIVGDGILNALCAVIAAFVLLRVTTHAKY